jgi:hypothetical protein
MTRRLALALSLVLIPAAAAAAAYPLSGYERTGIRRLWAYAAIESGELDGRSLPRGALMPFEDVRLRLVARPEFDIDAATPRDPVLQRAIEDLLADREGSTSIALLDMTDPTALRYAAVDETTTYLPGSVGKLLVATGLFDALARAFPDPTRRLEVLRDTWIEADGFVQPDSHTVPFADPAAETLAYRPIQPGDRFTLFEWLDHALSPSSNGAGATSWKQAMLLRRFGAAYPPSAQLESAFLRQTAKAELTALAVDALQAPLVAAGLNPDQLRQGTMFTRGGTAVVPGVRSYASPRELIRLLVRMEQGRLVDEFSSLELKRLLFYTKSRYRYAVSPALNAAAVYFKSGSFYRCRDEEGFRCRQYAGNVENVMNSVVIVENPAVPAEGQTRRVYMVALMSNVLRKNSAEDHRDLATEIDRAIARLHE